MKNRLKTDKGVAGLSILLSLVVMLFVIGLLVMIFSLMGTNLQTATYDTTTVAVNNETLTSVGTAGKLVSVSTLRDVSCSLTRLTNSTNPVLVSVTENFTFTGCRLRAVTTSSWNNSNVNITYSYTYEADNTATRVMNDTTKSVSSVTDWFEIFIVIGAMVVLILLTVLIITAIRGSGMVSGGESSGVNKVGSA